MINEKITAIEGARDEIGSFNVDIGHGGLVSSIVACRFNDLPHYRVIFNPDGDWAGGDILVNASHVATVTIKTTK